MGVEAEGRDDIIAARIRAGVGTGREGKAGVRAVERAGGVVRVTVGGDWQWQRGVKDV